MEVRKMKLNLNKTEKITVCVSFALLLVSSLLFSGLLKIETSKPFVGLDENGLQVTLNVKVYDANGNLKAEMCKDDDLVLSNFGNLLAGVFEDLDGNGNYPPDSFTETDSTTSNILCRYTEVVAFWEPPGSGISGGHIGIGNGTNAPAISDYNLQTQILAWEEVGDPTYSTGNVSLSATFTSDDSYNITEAGFLMKTDTELLILMFRDTFNAVEVVATDTVTVTYVIMLSSGFTDNFGNFLTGLLGSITTGEASKTFWMVDENEVNATYISRSGIVTEPLHWFLDGNLGSPIGAIKIGIGTTATARDDFNLQTVVEVTRTVNAPTYTGGDVTITCNHILSDDRDITEAGFFLKSRDNAGNIRSILMWRDVFSAESFNDGDVVNTVFSVTS